jgi:small subunit ribosomal protein S16
MAVKLRLTRAGAKKNPFYRVVVADSRSPRDGKFIERIGIYDPTRQPAEVRFDMERVNYWLSKGALPSETVGQLIERSRKEAAKDPGQGTAKPA